MDDGWQTPCDRYAPGLTWETCERIKVSYAGGLRELVIPRWPVPGGISIRPVGRGRWRDVRPGDKVLVEGVEQTVHSIVLYR
ncbi:MAG: hypothetical protein AAF805_00905 [Planctomycetota bacterium]